MELTMNSRSFNFSDYSHESEKSNKNSDLIMKRLRVKHKHTFFKKWFEKEHDYCLPTKNGCKVRQYVIGINIIVLYIIINKF